MTWLQQQLCACLLLFGASRRHKVKPVADNYRRSPEICGDKASHDTVAKRQLESLRHDYSATGSVGIRLS